MTEILNEQPESVDGSRASPLLCCVSYGEPSSNYETIKYTPGLYWTRGVVPYQNPHRPWKLVKVMKPAWTPESGKDHCQWYYSDGSGGKEIVEGEWILIPNPNDDAT